MNISKEDLGLIKAALAFLIEIQLPDILLNKEGNFDTLCEAEAQYRKAKDIVTKLRDSLEP